MLFNVIITCAILTCPADGCDGFQEGSVWNTKEAKRNVEAETTGQCEGDSTGADLCPYSYYYWGREQGPDSQKFLSQAQA